MVNEWGNNHTGKEEMKNMIFKDYLLFSILSITIGVGGIQIQNRSAFNTARTTKGIIKNTAKEDRSVFSRILLQKKRIVEKERKERAGLIRNLRKGLARMSWAKTYGDSYYDYPQSFQQTSDGGYIVSGGSSLYSSSSWMEACVLKLSSEGEIQWQNSYDGADSASSIRQTIDGGYVAAGYTSTNAAAKNDFWILKLDSAGNTEWQRTCGGNNEDRAKSISQTAEGGYIVAGVTKSFGAGKYDFWIIKLFSSGDVDWQRTYGGLEDDLAESIQQTADGGYIVAGSTKSFGIGGRDFLVLKLFSSGDIDWQRTYGGIEDDNAYCIQPTVDGGYIVAGETYSVVNSNNIWVIKLSSAGSIEWQRAYGGYASSGRAAFIWQTSDGGYIVAGETDSFGSGSYDIWILKLDSSGALEWQRTYGGLGTELSYVVQQTADGKYVVLGLTWSFGAGNSDFLILKLESTGEIERLPELTHLSNVVASETSLPSQQTAIIPQDTTVDAAEPDVTCFFSNKQARLVFSPPSAFWAERELNRSLSQAEYVDFLTWQANPNNNDLNIAKYRVYQLGAYYPTEVEKQLLAELGPKTFQYTVRKRQRYASYTYAVAAVTDKNEESILAKH
jgi:uncharacterized delta-60 repeat protein